MGQALRKPIPEHRPYADRIRERVEADDVLGARALLAEALESGETGKDVLAWQRVLAPAKMIRVAGGERAPDPVPDFRWLSEHSKEYDGQWVALLSGELLAHAPSLKEVLSILKQKEPRKATLVHRIYYQAAPAALAEARTYAEKIRLLVEADLVGEARKVLAEALARGGHNEDLSGWQRVLAPARVTRVGGARDIDRKDDFHWLKDCSKPYQGQWVALLGGKLLAHAETLQEILSQLKSHPSGNQALLHRIH